jgi:hypothetical protein
MPVRPKPGARAKIRPYDASVVIRQECGPYDASAAKIPPPDENPTMSPTASQAYDLSVVIRPQNTIPVRSISQNPYDANLAKSTMPNKFATGK